MSASNPPASLLLAACLAALAACASTPPPQVADPIGLDGAPLLLEGKRYMRYSVGTTIAAPPETVWAILTDAPSYPSWNTEVLSIDGSIAPEQRIRLKAKIDPDRTFKLEVSHFDPARKLVWEDGNGMFRGVRTFTLTATADGGTDVTMAEVLTGAMLPMIAKKLPDFRPSFRAFAADLKREAEARAAT